MPSVRSKKEQLADVALTRLGAMRRGKRQFQPTCWPGQPDLRFKLGLLSCDDAQVSQASARRRFDELGLDPNETVNMPLFADEVVVQVLFRACRDEQDTDQPFAESADDLRANTEAEERAALFDSYIEFQSSCDPRPQDLGADVIAEIREAIKKKDASRLKGYGSSMLVNFLLTGDSPPPSSLDGSSSSTPTG